MSDNLAPAHARESAERWADLQVRLDPVPAGLRGHAARLRVSAYLAGYELGLNQAQADWAVERSVGQAQLDDAHALMVETAQLLRGYEAHHRDKVDKLLREPGPNHAERPEWLVEQGLAINETTAKAERNALQASRLEAWLRGEDLYPVSLPGSDDVGIVMLRIAAEAMPIRAEIAGDGQLVPLDTLERDYPGVTSREQARRIADRNVRPVTGALAEPGVADSIMGALAGPAGGVSVVKAGAFKIQTGDPRFDPAEPLTVNGYLFTPAKEA